MKKVREILILIISVLLLSTNISLAETGIVNTDAVRLREDSNTNSNIIVNIYKDEEVEILETLEEWYKVKYNNDVGYVKKEYLKVENNIQELILMTIQLFRQMIA